jgi:hypothetical protein
MGTGPASMKKSENQNKKGSELGTEKYGDEFTNTRKIKYRL